MRSIEFSKYASSPDKKLLVNRKSSWERSSSNSCDPWKREFFEENRNRRAFWRGPSSKLSLSVWSHNINLSLHGESDSVRLSTRHLIDFIRNFADVDRSRLISQKPKTELTMLTSSTGKKSSNVVNKCRMFRPTVYLLNIWSIVAIEIGKPRTEDNSHASRASVAPSTLTIIIASPRVNVSRSAKKKGMDITTLDINRAFV